MLRQVTEFIDLACENEKLRFELMQDCLNYVAENFNEDSQPNKLATEVNQYVKQRTNCGDAYLEQKSMSNEIALSILPKVNDILKTDNSLETYVKASIVGNILDFGVYNINTDFKSLINSNLNKDLSINDIDEFEKSLNNYREVLYLVDNAGEIVFDRLLIEKIKEYDVNVTVAVKSGPIVNDACIKEAIDVGLDDIAEIITIGADSGGIVKEMISKDFKKVLDECNFIISKGMANYEGLTEMDFDNKDVFFLLCTKCNSISEDLGVNKGSFILKKL